MICNLFLDIGLCCSPLETFSPIGVVKGLMNSTFLNLKSFFLSTPWLFLFKQKSFVNISRHFTSKWSYLLSRVLKEQSTSDKAIWWRLVVVRLSRVWACRVIHHYWFCVLSQWQYSEAQLVFSFHHLFLNQWKPLDKKWKTDLLIIKWSMCLTLNLGANIVINYY